MLLLSVLKAWLFKKRLCPVCDGAGKTYSQYTDEETGRLFIRASKCERCNGAGVVP